MTKANRFRFRAWDGGEMCDVEGWIDDMNGRLLHLYRRESADHIESYADTETVLMQSTGLTDKHGVEVFEGDIVRVPPQGPGIAECGYGTTSGTAGLNFVVTWGRFDPVDGSDPVVGFTLPEEWSSCEVIGSIHEHPELLKQEEG